MRSAVYGVLIPFFVLFAAAGAPAAKITVDPNAPGTKREAEPEKDIFKADPRLAQKVTIEVKGKSVLAILGQLGEKTGITLKAGANETDWQVRDRKMSLFAKDVPLGEIMRSIARVMKFAWLRGGKTNQWHYRIYMDRKTLLDTETMRQRDEAARDERGAERRASGLDVYTRMADLSPAELAKLKTANPFLYVIAESGLARSLGGFFGQAPAAAEAIYSGQEINMSAASLSPGAQQALVRAMQDLRTLERRFNPKQSELSADLAANIPQATIRINRNLESMRGNPMEGVVLGEMNVSCGEAHFDVPFVDPESSLAKLIGKALVKSGEENRPVDEVMKELQGEMIAAVTSEMKRDPAGEPEPEHPDAPKLHEKIKLKADGSNLEDVQAALAEASGLAVVSDSFGRSRGFGPVSGEESEIVQVLDRIATGYRYNWELHGPVIEFRDKEWFSKRAAQIPDAWIEQWKDMLKKTGTLDIDTMAQMAALTQEQFDVNMFSDETLRGVSWSVRGNREILRLYATLSNEQRAMFFGEAGLDTGTLSPEQSKLAEKMLSRRGAPFATGPEVRIVLGAKREQKNKLVTYTFTATPDDGQQLLRWSFETPRYEEPKPPPEKQTSADKPKQVGPDKPK